ncbi:short-chain fatty acyl-CoA regulator family protein [Aestuariicoccus sp. MJ-SS9]|uniref:helix-turn-helix domain-containing protein n=1 Tax=Aestuariicoccus sp. MJ-SS9 TaxID=3079855 RepID=UPI00290901F2|nr:short-chain fatty acyl-CoA regulator family protein [Aestuariicoccus sp. MJ-SS9]MDU8912378.1 short-chain fatty acyl-CoA regulator family protein [Aestuariicoccus sp. MJ-SS9]
MRKTFVGPQLRQLRRLNNHTQAEMAKRLGISPAYVNLLENNQRSLSVQVLLSLTESYGVDLKTLVQDQETNRLADLRAAVRDPVFSGPAPDLAELRGALDHAPGVAERFLQLYQNHRALMDQVKKIGGEGSARDLLLISPETAIHDYFRDRGNHFDALETAATALRDRVGGSADDMYTLLKRQLRVEHGIQTGLRRITDMPDSLRVFDEDEQIVHLSEALDHTNRIFQLAHVLGMVEATQIVDGLVDGSGIDTNAGRERLRVELNNYFAGAMLMPYDAFLELAEATLYDIDRLAAAFGVSFEQVCHRLTTLQRDGARGVPFFFLRVDRAGNVTKRFNATAFTLAEEGGSCPIWDIHGAFRVPGVIVPQFVELPEGGQFFTVSRTTDRPVFSRQTQDRRLVVAIGCERVHAERIGYAQRFNMDDPNLFSPIGINCQLCPRQACSQRAHQPLHMNLPIDAHRRGSTRYES